jgi:hypothetical protein
MPEVSACFSAFGALCFNSERHLAAVESFRVAAGGVAFHPPQPHEGEKRVLSKPAFGVLGLERVYDVSGFLLTDVGLEWDKKARLPEVSIVLWDFIFQNEMIAKRVPSQLR